MCCRWFGGIPDVILLHEATLRKSNDNRRRNGEREKRGMGKTTCFMLMEQCREKYRDGCFMLMEQCREKYRDVCLCKWNIAGKSTDMYVYVNGIVQRKVQRCIVYYMLMEQCREKYRDVCFINFEQST